MGTQKTVKTPKELGEVISAMRVAQGIRADEFDVSHVCLGGIERGKETAQIGKVMAVLAALGIRVTLEMPPGMRLPEPGAKKRQRVSK